MAWARSRCALVDQNCVVNWEFVIESGLVRKDSIKVLDNDGFALKRDCCSSTSDFKRSSSYHELLSLPAPNVDDTALAIAIAAEEDAPLGAVDTRVLAWEACIALLRASLIASASDRAAVVDVNEKTCVSGAKTPGACAKIFSITFGLLAGVC